MGKLKCNNCEKTFLQDEAITYCPHCQSEDYVKEHSGIQKAFNRHKRLILLVLAGIALLLVIRQMVCTPPIGPEPKAYEVAFMPNPEEGIITIDFYYRTVYEHEVGTRTPVRDDATIARLLNAYNFRIFHSNEKSPAKQGNVIYPFLQPDTLEVSWEDHENFPLYRPHYTRERVPYHGKVNPPPVNLRIIRVENLPGCKVQIKTNYDQFEDSANVAISIDGKKGIFETRREWDMTGVENYQIYAALNQDTVPYLKNPQPYHGVGCIAPPSVDAIIQAGNRFGQNPNSEQYADAFFELMRNYITDYYIGADPYDEPSLENTMVIEHLNNGTTYRVSSSSINISGANIKIRFIAD